MIISVSGCRKNNDQFYIVNNSDETIIPVHNGMSLLKNPIYSFHPEKCSSREYSEFLWDRISPHSSRDLSHFHQFLNNTPDDTLYIGIFNLCDIDTMSLEEFKIKYPIKHEYKITLQDMIDNNWTLVYPPSE